MFLSANLKFAPKAAKKNLMSPDSRKLKYPKKNNHPLQ
jgi:hypothetical protein